ncbi:MAG: hypothetical protein L3K23_02900 [Thermoplasmata archaeon]|nr:hypothetical protein [Thermoplasmata archaeon]
MRWTSFHPVGVAYDVLEGPFAGSRFFLYYTPRGQRTGVTVAGEFVSPTLPSGELEKAVDAFLATEFRQDRDALLRGTGRRAPAGLIRGRDRIASGRARAVRPAAQKAG